ncbi:MAG: DUF3501 family protein [Polyangiaceae bacterium]|nr:DUF3501 family protein [Polyangiaceae bacterium]
MRLVTRGELLGLEAYEQVRDRFRARLIEEKRARRVALGDHMTVLFENHDTVLFQIQEMLRTERITRESAILHELETYNALVPGADELSATVFVEYPERAERERMLVALAGLEACFYVAVGGARHPGVCDRAAEHATRTTAVHYVRFPLGPQAAARLRAGSTAAVGVAHPAYTHELELAPATLASLREDLAAASP